MQIEAAKNINSVKLEITYYSWLSFILGSLYKKWPAFDLLVNEKYILIYKNI